MTHNYVASDGTVFSNENECKQHEVKIFDEPARKAGLVTYDYDMQEIPFSTALMGQAHMLYVPALPEAKRILRNGYRAIDLYGSLIGVKAGVYIWDCRYCIWENAEDELKRCEERAQVLKEKISTVRNRYHSRDHELRMERE